MKRFISTASVAFSAFGLASTASANNANLGPLKSTNSFYYGHGGGGAEFTDVYSFSIAQASNVFGRILYTSETTYTVDPVVPVFSKVTIGAVFLRAADSATVLASDYSPEQFTFANLSAGNYKLYVNGFQYLSAIFDGAYVGVLNANSASTSSVPEPSVTALTLLGLGVAGLLKRKSRR